MFARETGKSTFSILHHPSTYCFTCVPSLKQCKQDLARFGFTRTTEPPKKQETSPKNNGTDLLDAPSVSHILTQRVRWFSKTCPHFFCCESTLVGFPFSFHLFLCPYILSSFLLLFFFRLPSVHIQQSETKSPNQERTYIMIKPDGVQRGLIGKIISRFEDRGFKLQALELQTPSKERLEAHYEDLKSKKFFPGLIEYMSSGPVCCMVWEGLDAVKTGRVMLGETMPLKSAPGTIRGDFCLHVGRNICHGSDAVESAEREIAMVSIIFLVLLFLFHFLKLKLGNQLTYLSYPTSLGCFF
jgi:nucleoside-diphosphate kinase